MKDAIEDETLTPRGLARRLSPAAQEILMGDDLTIEEVGDAMGVLARFGFLVWIDPTDKARAFPVHSDREDAMRRMHEYHRSLPARAQYALLAVLERHEYLVSLGFADTH